MMIPALTPDEANQNAVFQLGVRSSKDMKANHLWVSIVSCPPESTFTRVQRLSVALCLLLMTMLTSLMFHGIPTDDPDDQVKHAGISVSLSDIMIGIQSGLIMFPVNFLIMQLFTRLEPRECKFSLQIDKKLCEHTGDFEGVLKTEMSSNLRNSESKENDEFRNKSEGRSSTLILGTDDKESGNEISLTSKDQVQSELSPTKMRSVNQSLVFEQEQSFVSIKSDSLNTLHSAKSSSEYSWKHCDSQYDTIPLLPDASGEKILRQKRVSSPDLLLESKDSQLSRKSSNGIGRSDIQNDKKPFRYSCV